MSQISRRDVLLATSATLAATRLARATEGTGAVDQTSLPGLPVLLKRKEPEWCTNEELRFIGMPVGGLFAGTVYLSGEGQLWNWDVFNLGRFGCVDRPNTTFMGESLNAMGGANYVDPIRPKSPFRQAFSALVGGKPVRFGDIRFRGEYPVGKVRYANGDADIEMELEAFSPFCPLDAENSSFPATTMTYRVTNVGTKPIDVTLQYATENPVLLYAKGVRSDFELTASQTEGGVRFGANAKKLNEATRPDIVFTDWHEGTYGDWKVTGTAFGDSPRRVKDLPSYMGRIDAGTEFVVNTHQNRNGEDVVQADQHVGTLTSPEFKVERPMINMRVGGGSHVGETCINLVVDGRVVRSVTGRDSNLMRWESFPVSEFIGKTAHLQVVDRFTGGWGQISLGEVIFSDRSIREIPLEKEPDFGTFAVEVVGGASQVTANTGEATVAKTLRLAPKATAEVTFIVAWHFPNAAGRLPGKRNWYAKRWADADAVVQDLGERWPKLQEITRTWNRTWYDSTLPHWFLDRTFVNLSILATTTCHRLDEGRYWFFEGVGCCDGTCTHVWGYAQAIGRVFPEIERYLRKEIDFGMAFHPETGAIDYRGEYGREVAVDGHASCILRAYREHQMSPNLEFLRSIWPQVKGAMRLLIQQDVNRDGILDGPQYNTLDTVWYGEIAWISSLYLAALRASEAMAETMGDAAFAEECAKLAESGGKQMVKDLFNGEYFIHKVDAAHPEANNTNVGCHIDQVYGQSWAHQVGLPRVLPAAETKSALRALFRHSFYEDIWEYRRHMKAIPGGRWYAVPKEAGLIMCSFPRGGAAESVGRGNDAWAVQYFNECMAGFEYQVANHMIAEGMVEEGLKVVYAIHDRYHPRKRNPYNEIECSDHYGRSMASYGAFVSICGFVNDGPNHRMTFSPKVKGHFRVPFINERGWGTYDSSLPAAKQVAYAHRLA